MIWVKQITDVLADRFRVLAIPNKPANRSAPHGSNAVQI